MDKKYDSVYSILLDILKQVENGGGGSSVKIIDDLLSTSTVDGLSANQGRVLKELIDAIQVELTTVDNRLGSVEDDLAGVVATADKINGEII